MISLWCYRKARLPFPVTQGSTHTFCIQRFQSIQFGCKQFSRHATKTLIIELIGLCLKMMRTCRWYFDELFFFEMKIWNKGMVGIMLCFAMVFCDSVLRGTFKVTSLELGQLCPSASEVTLKNMGKYITCIYKGTDDPTKRKAEENICNWM